jgi:mono/diheme cytochrome c family protein
MRPPRSSPSLAIFVLLLAGALTLSAADPAATLFRQSCMSCHTIGGGTLVGPDLKNVAQRKDRAWLVSFVANPKAKLDAGDPYALELKQEARGAIMPNIAGMTPAKAAALLDLIEAESKLPKSQFLGLDIGDQPFSRADIELGRQIFTGERGLANGGPACISCHQARGLRGLGGGQLGPDLTKVYERMQGRKNLAAWMQAPATPTMGPLFTNTTLTNEEIVPLVAYFEHEAKTSGPDQTGPQLRFLLMGLGGAALGLLGADSIWRKRFRDVRKSMVRRGDR